MLARWRLSLLVSSEGPSSLASALPSCQRVGTGQARAHQMPQLLHQLPKPLGKDWDGPQQAGSVAVCRGGKVGQARWDLLPKDRS